MKTRQREHGTIEFFPENSEDRIAAFRQIVESGSYAKIEGTMIDLTSANLVVKIYDTLNEINKAKFSSMPAEKMAKLAYKLVN